MTVKSFICVTLIDTILNMLHILNGDLPVNNFIAVFMTDLINM